MTALEALGLEVDPIRNTLKEAQLLMLSAREVYMEKVLVNHYSDWKA
ncbi:MAG: hypothetical protein FGF52_05195 [Candidatus Brockarchaeota archaeon]|nr:hypothetical protein [Candidatus Brockarchaeota archaeon]